MNFLSQIPQPASGSIESWLLSAAAVMAMIVLGKKLFVRTPPLESEFVSRSEFKMFNERVYQQREDAAIDLARSAKEIEEKNESRLAEIWRAIRENRASQDDTHLNNQEKILNRCRDLEVSIAELRGQLRHRPEAIPHASPAK